MQNHHRRLHFPYKHQVSETEHFRYTGPAAMRVRQTTGFQIQYYQSFWALTHWGTIDKSDWIDFDVGEDYPPPDPKKYEDKWITEKERKEYAELIKLKN
tara:strand:- start:556 stop:852 length:297 start_codon:yes stop_codon:yes gene_type:complete